MKDKVINDLLKRVSDLEFEVERLEKRVEQEKRIVDIKDKDMTRLYERINKAIEILDIYGTSNYETADLLYSALRGSEKE